MFLNFEIFSEVTIFYHIFAMQEKNPQLMELLLFLAKIYVPIPKLLVGMYILIYFIPFPFFFLILNVDWLFVIYGRT